MGDVLTQHALEVAPAENDQPVEAFAARAPNPAFGEAVRNRHLQRRANHPHAFGANNMLDGERELLVLVANEMPNGYSQVVDLPA